MCFNEITTPYDLYYFMKENIIYGFVSNYDNKIYTRKGLNNDLIYDRLIIESYFLQTPAELLENKCGVCYDQVEFARFWLEYNNYNVYTFFTPIHNHAFLIYEKNNNFYLFETTLKPINGIHEFQTLDDAINFFKGIESIYNNKKMEDILIYPYDNVVYGCSFFDFISNIVKDNKLILKRQ
jgi:hypothetical protein